MIAIKFDECFNDPAVIEVCNNEKLIEAHELDDNLFHKKDPEVLGVLMSRTIPMITTDRALPDKHTACIPERNPGIIVVANCRYYREGREALKTMTSAAAARILSQFKARVREWHRLEVNNSIVEITNKGVMIWHVEAGRLRFDEYLLYDDERWKDNEALRADLVRYLSQNLERHRPPLLGQGDEGEPSHGTS